MVVAQGAPKEGGLDGTRAPGESSSQSSVYHIGELRDVYKTGSASFEATAKGKGREGRVPNCSLGLKSRICY